MKSLIALLIFITTQAAASPEDHNTRLSVLHGWKTSDGHQYAALRIDLASGWKTYWRAPGDAGIPPLIDWSASENIESVAPHWPVPEVFGQGGARSIGYHDTLTIPVRILPRDTGENVRLTGKIEIGVCEEICVPVTLVFDEILAVKSKRNPAIVASLLNRPETQAEAGIGAVTCKVAPSELGMNVTVQIPNGGRAGDDVVIIETADPQVWVSEPKTRQAGGILSASADLIHVMGDGFALDRSGIRITILGERRAVDIRGCKAP